MKKQQITIGGVYSAKITDKVVPVRIDAENKNGGWDATNIHTNRKVRIKSAQKLRSRITVPPNDDEPTSAKQPVKKRLTAAERKTARSTDGGKKAKATPKAKPAAKPKKLSLIDAAVQVLGESKEPMNCKQIVEQVTAKKLWSSNAATPWATLYSAILRETQNKGEDARFTKVERGRFTLSAAGKKGA